MLRRGSILWGVMLFVLPLAQATMGGLRGEAAHRMHCDTHRARRGGARFGASSDVAHTLKGLNMLRPIPAIAAVVGLGVVVATPITLANPVELESISWCPKLPVLGQNVAFSAILKNVSGRELVVQVPKNFGRGITVYHQSQASDEMRRVQRFRATGRPIMVEKTMDPKDEIVLRWMLYEEYHPSAILQDGRHKMRIAVNVLTSNGGNTVSGQIEEFDVLGSPYAERALQKYKRVRQKVDLSDSVKKGAEAYKRFIQEWPHSPMTPYAILRYGELRQNQSRRSDEFGFVINKLKAVGFNACHPRQVRTKALTRLIGLMEEQYSSRRLIQKVRPIVQELRAMNPKDPRFKEMTGDLKEKAKRLRQNDR